MIISIDGPASSGKSTVAKLVAKKLNFFHFNSGALYRGVTCYLISSGVDIQNGIGDTNDITLTTNFIDGEQHVYVNGKDYTPHLRDNIVSELSPIVSQHKPIRNLIDDCQRSFATSHNVVIDGRDIGSFVFPNADYKFYLDCDVNILAQRRFLEEQKKNSGISFEEIKKQLIERDEFDKHKPISPLVVPKNAIIVDSSNKTIEQVVDEILSFIKLK